VQTFPRLCALNPFRLISKSLLYLRILLVCISPLFRDPWKIRPTWVRLAAAWSNGGVGQVKKVLLGIPHEVSFNEIWRNYQRTITPKLHKRMIERVAKLEHRPLVSILLKVDGVDLYSLKRTIDSIFAQLYPNWELCIIANEPVDKLEPYYLRDSRMRIEFAQADEPVSSTMNRALATSTGSYVVILQRGIIFQKYALLRLAESVLKDDPDIIYSDEILLSEDGREAVFHHYRSSFSLDYFRSYIDDISFLTLRASLLERIGGFDASITALVNYNLILHASEQAEVIVHIPEVLALVLESDEFYGGGLPGITAAINIVSLHLQRCREVAVVVPGVTSRCIDIRYLIKSGQRVAIIIPTKNHGELVRQCVESIERTVVDIEYDIIVIDHASTDSESISYFKRLAEKHVVTRYEGSFNFSSINNWAVSQLPAIYSHYLFCNNDIEAINSGWLERMMELCQNSAVGIVGSKLLYPGGDLLQHGGVCVGMYGAAEHYAKFMHDKLPNHNPNPGYHGKLVVSHDVSAVTAACFLMRCDAFKCVGGFDEELAVGFGDVDICLRTMKAGYRIIFCPQASLIHHESFTRGKSTNDPHPADTLLFVKKWRDFIEDGDPYYNSNLSLQSTQWEANFHSVFKLEVGRRVVSLSHIEPFSRVSVRY
jgi:GT2 family glycosyltransferase